MTVGMLYAKVNNQWVPAATADTGIDTEAAIDAVAAALRAGTGISVAYNDPAGTITIANTAAAVGFDPEDAVDAVAAAMTAGANIDITYNDAANTLTVAVEPLVIGDISGLQTNLNNIDTALTAKADAAATTAALAGKQPLDPDLTTLAGLVATTDNIVQSVAGAWASRTPIQVKTALTLNNVDNTSDANKPVSTAQAAADALRVLKTGDTMSGTLTIPGGSIAGHAVNKGQLDLKFDKSGGTITGPTTFLDTVTMNGALNLNGDIHANYFYGDGSNLTNLNASQLQTGIIPTGRFPATIPSNTTGTAAAWTTGRLISLAGDLAGTVTIKGDADATLTATIVANSIALGTDTTGNFVASVVGTANQVITNNPAPGENIAHTLSLPQNIHAAATPTFSQLTLAVALGTPPLVVASSTKVVNLNADLLDGNDSTFFTNAGNLSAGVLPSARIAGAYTGLTRAGTLDQLTVVGASSFTGATTFSIAPKVGVNDMWHAGNDGPTSGLDADTVDGKHASYFASDDEVEALMGDLLAVGLYDAAAYDGTDATKPTPDWARGPDVYWHNIYWICHSSGEVDFLDSDYSGRSDEFDVEVDLFHGDWVIALDPDFGSPGHEQGTDQPLSQMVFQYIPFSAETYVKAMIGEHAADPLDPHSAAGYLKQTLAVELYAPLIHGHDEEIVAYFDLHRQEVDPHPGYLTEDEATQIYVKPDGLLNLPYEKQGAVVLHESNPDAHPQYTTQDEADILYAPNVHVHPELSPADHTHPSVDEISPTDDAPSSRIFIGGEDPVAPVAGDLWFQTYDINLQPPVAPAELTLVVATTSIVLNWSAWPASTEQAGAQIEWSPNGVSGWTSILDDQFPPFLTTFTHAGLAERTTYYYRLRATNNATPVGVGVWGYVNGTTLNAPPPAPVVAAPALGTATSIVLIWTAVTVPANDPLDALPYEVFKNGVSQGRTAALTWTFSGLTENTTYSLGVRVHDNVGLVSAITTRTGCKTDNAAPPQPATVTAANPTHSTATISWTPVTGISDFGKYQVYRSGTYVADVAGTSYNFIGLSPSTGYNLGVRTVDDYSAVSAIKTVAVTTDPNPDTTPPAAVTGVAWYPRSSYGQMWFEFTAPAEATYGEVLVHSGSGWVLKYSGAISGNREFNLGTFAAGKTVYAAVNTRDANNNWRYGTHYAYTLVASPVLFAPHSSNTWRAGIWGVSGGYKVYQGYYSDGSLNARGFWFYGRDFQNWWRAGRTITLVRIMGSRDGCGTNQDDHMYLWLHDIESNPGNVAAATPYMQSGPYDSGVTLRYSDVKWMTVPDAWGSALCAGTARGFGVYASGGKPYVCLHPAGAAYSGVVEISHLG